MRAVLQRVSHASVCIDGSITGEIGPGLLILLGIETSDGDSDVDWLCKKISSLRIFGDQSGQMNRSILDINGEVLIVSQFTLFASYKKGNRPSYLRAARPEEAIPLYKNFCRTIEALIMLPVKTGEFGANMQVTLCNDGPVTITIDSKNKE